MSFLTTFQLIKQSLVPAMIDKKSERIINNSSIFLNSAVNRTAYASTKAAIIGATKTWALELAQHGIMVNATERDQLLSKVPLARLADPHEVASMVEYLASDGARLCLHYCVDAND